MSKKIKLSQDMVGNKVRCVNKIDIHHPEPGTIGTIVIYDEFDTICNYKVQWPKGSTVGDDMWWAINSCIELVEDDVTNEQGNLGMTNEEIWKMLESKMRKNGLKPCGSRLLLTNGIANVYAWEDVHNAIALAYKAGYLRSQKGRPFKIGEKKVEEKKQGGHWKPVDIKDVLTGEYKIVENCLGWRCEYLGTYKKGEDGKFYQWVEDDE